MKYFEVNVVANTTYTVRAKNEDEALDLAADDFAKEFDTMWANELSGEEAIERSRRYSDVVIESEA